jgi:hypothetical protein
MFSGGFIYLNGLLVGIHEIKENHESGRQASVIRKQALVSIQRSRESLAHAHMIEGNLHI